MADESRQPGDIIVRAVPGGVLIGRALERIGPAPWWQYIATLPDIPVAIRLARELAGASKVRAWMQTPDDTYTEITLGTSDTGR